MRKYKQPAFLVVRKLVLSVGASIYYETISTCIVGGCDEYEGAVGIAEWYSQMHSRAAEDSLLDYTYEVMRS